MWNYGDKYYKKLITNNELEKSFFQPLCEWKTELIESIKKLKIPKTIEIENQNIKNKEKKDDLYYLIEENNKNTILKNISSEKKKIEKEIESKIKKIKEIDNKLSQGNKLLERKAKRSLKNINGGLSQSIQNIPPSILKDSKIINSINNYSSTPNSPITNDLKKISPLKLFKEIKNKKNNDSPPQIKKKIIQKNFNETTINEKKFQKNKKGRFSLESIYKKKKEKNIFKNEESKSRKLSLEINNSKSTSFSSINPKKLSWKVKKIKNLNNDLKNTTREDHSNRRETMNGFLISKTNKYLKFL
jgi:hypothetical protein